MRTAWLVTVWVWCLPLVAALAAESPNDNTQRLIDQLSPETDDKVRVEAVLLLGKIGGLPALRAVAGAYRSDPYPLVVVSAAQALGKSGDARWIQVLASRTRDRQPVIAAAARLWTRRLGEAFARVKAVPDGIRRWVDLVDLESRTRSDLDFELANRYRDALAERLMRVDGVDVGVELEFTEDEVGGDGAAAKVDPADRPLDERVPLLAQGAITSLKFERGDDRASATISGKLRFVVLPFKSVACHEATATATWNGPIEDPDAEDADVLVPAIEALVEKLYARMGPAVK